VQIERLAAEAATTASSEGDTAAAPAEEANASEENVAKPFAEEKAAEPSAQEGSSAEPSPMHREALTDAVTAPVAAPEPPSEEVVEEKADKPAPKKRGRKSAATVAAEKAAAAAAAPPKKPEKFVDDRLNFKTVKGRQAFMDAIRVKVQRTLSAREAGEHIPDLFELTELLHHIATIELYFTKKQKDQVCRILFRCFFREY
jgi:hypothetical protein